MKILHLLLVLVALGAISATRAQNADEPFAPKVPPSAPPPALPENSEPAAADTDNKVVVPELKGLVFIGDRSAIQPDGVGTEGVEIVSLPLLATPGFRAQAAAYIGRPLNLHLLNQLTREVVLYFRQHDRPIVDVSVPEQNISAGAVQILVLEGRLGRVRVEGNHWFSKNSIARDIRQRPGKPITGAPLLEDIAWLNQNPFRHVDLVFEKGAKPGETDIVLRTQDRLPVRVFADYEDSGTAQTGRDRLQAGINWGDAFGRNQQMSYQITGNPDFEKLVEHSISYVMPIPALRQTLSLFAFYADSRPAYPDFDIDGRTWQTSLRYDIPLPARGALTNDFSFGFDFKRSNSNLFYGGEQIFKHKNDIVQAVATYKLDRVDKHGVTHAEVSLTASPGGVTAFNHTSDYRAAGNYPQAGYQAHADYAYARVELDRTTKLPGGLAWVVRGTGQIASANLLSSEQLGFGGYQSLRGYDEYAVAKDNGAILVNELHGPSFSVIRNFGGRVALGDKLDPLVFIDYGIGGNHNTPPSSPSSTQMGSFGLGLRYAVATNLDVRFDYGWQIRGYRTSNSTGDHQRGHIGVVLAY